MTFFLGQDNSSWIDLGIPFSVELKKEEDAPADSLSVSFPYSGEIPQLPQLHMYKNGSLAFDGIVDEQAVSFGTKGLGSIFLSRERSSFARKKETTS